LGLEDSALGFELQVRHIPIVPLPVLENAEAPEGLVELFRQKVRWFLGPLGVLGYAMELRAKGIRISLREWVIAFQGLLSALKWAFSGPLVIAYAVVAVKGGVGWLGFGLYLLYCYATVSFVLITLKKKAVGPFRPFPRTGFPVLLLYPLAPLIHSAAGLYGLVYWTCKSFVGASYVQGKTERS
jgi:cellulose synthase/poly-beta-1,6-N-acetylglucosamine synthase-like glycosyltransferase